MIRKIVLLLGILASSLYAQNEVKVQIVTFALGAPPGGFKAFFKNGQEIQPFGANGNGLGAPVAYTGPRRFIIRESEESFAPPPAGQQAPPPMALVDIPEGTDNVLLLAVAAGQGKIRLLAYDVSSKALQGGDYRVFNFSNSALELNLGKKKLTLRPAQNEMLTDASFRDPNTKVMEFVVYKYNGNVRNPEPVKRSLWEHWNTRRIVMFLFDGKHKGEAFGMMTMNVEPIIQKPAAAASP
jgi:hypothetical protein